MYDTSSTPFFLPVALKAGPNSVNVSAPFVPQLPVDPSMAVAVLTPRQGSPMQAGLYVQNRGLWLLALKQVDVSDALIADATVSVYIELPSTTAVPTGGTLFVNASESTDTSMTVKNVVYAVTVPAASGGGAVTSVAGRTGIVVLAAADIASGVLTVAQGGTGVATLTGIVRGNGTGAFSASALVAADIPALDAAKITTGAIPVARGGTGLATATGYIKGAGTTAAAVATIPVADGGTGAVTLTTGGYLKGAGTGAVTSQTGIPAADITSGTLVAARLPVATAAAQGIMQVGGGLSVTTGTVSVAAVGAVAGNIGGVTRQAAQADSAATDIAGMVTDFNLLLAKLRTAGILA